MCAIRYCITLFAVSNCVIYTKIPVARIVSFCNPPVVVSGEEGTTRPRFCGRSCGKRSELRRSSAGAGVSLLLPFLCRFPGGFPAVSRSFPGGFPELSRAPRSFPGSGPVTSLGITIWQEGERLLRLRCRSVAHFLAPRLAPCF